MGKLIVFTGIIENTGKVLSLTPVREGARLVLGSRLARSLRLGASIAVDGCCVTVAAKKGDILEADLSRETLSRTTLGKLGERRKIAVVNLERPMAADGRFGGHIVQGHVDGVGERGKQVRLDGEVQDVVFRAPPPLLPFLAEKGSVAVNGVSLTVNRVLPDGFVVTLIPFTRSHTNLGKLAEGDPVNLEVDIVAKYLARAAEAYLSTGGSRV